MLRNKNIAAMVLAAATSVGAVAPAAEAQTMAGPIANAANGHQYYLIRIANSVDYKLAAQLLGGYPVVINNAAENAWIMSNLYPLVPTQFKTHIGLNDEGVEGEWRWLAGVTDTYSNWAPGEPNNFTNQDYAILTPSGQWDDWIAPVAGDPLPYAVVEVGGGLVGQPAGVFYGPVRNPANGHDYYVLSNSRYDAAEAFAVENFPGGHLAVINDAAENEFVARNVLNLAGLGVQVGIGLTDFNNEGTFIWHTLSSSTYRRWAPGEPNAGTAAEDYVCMYTISQSAALLGFWNDASDASMPHLIEVAYCPGDFNHSGAVSVQDIFDFLAGYFAGCP